VHLPAAMEALIMEYLVTMTTRPNDLALGTS
jgi:hypothetical protein